MSGWVTQTRGGSTGFQAVSFCLLAGLFALVVGTVDKAYAAQHEQPADSAQLGRVQRGGKVEAVAKLSRPPSPSPGSSEASTPTQQTASASSRPAPPAEPPTPMVAWYEPEEPECPLPVRYGAPVRRGAGTR